MKSVSSLSLDLSAPNIAAVAYAVQNDRSARHIVAQLCDGSATWTPPAGAAPVIRYVKPDGTGGFYDADDNDDPAIVISGSKADMTIVEQALTVPGDVYMQLHFYAADGTRLTSFAWILRVQQSVLNDATIVSSDYFNVLTAKVAQAVQAASAAAESAAAAAASAASISIPLPITSGGTDATTAAGARGNIGLGNVANERQYSAENPPPYPVTSVNGQTGDVDLEKVTDFSITATVGSGVAIRRFNFHQIGRIVFGEIYFDVTSALSNNSIVATLSSSLPNPYDQYALATVRNISGSFGMVSIGRGDSGAIKAWGAIPEGTYNYAQFVYVAR